MSKFLFQAFGGTITLIAASVRCVATSSEKALMTLKDTKML